MNTPIYYKDYIGAERQKQLAICLEELEQIVLLQEIFREGVTLMPYYLIEYLDETLFFEFTEMLKNGQYVKRCKLCGRYFVLADKRKRDFCDRPYKDRRTCK